MKPHSEQEGCAWWCEGIPSNPNNPVIPQFCMFRYRIEKLVAVGKKRGGYKWHALKMAKKWTPYDCMSHWGRMNYSQAETWPGLTSPYRLLRSSPPSSWATSTRGSLEFVTGCSCKIWPRKSEFSLYCISLVFYFFSFQLNNRPSTFTFFPLFR